MNEKNYIVSLSGGKDSTAMLLMMIERNIPIHSIIFFDTGWEFPGIIEHIDLLEKNINKKIWRLHPRLPFDYWMFAHPVAAKKGPKKGQVHRIGYGWPSYLQRWCTSRKTDTLDYYAKKIPDRVQCIGFAADEKKRIKKNDEGKRYPLIEWDITEAEALQYCYDRGYTWGGLYEHFDRVSCFCCPLQRLQELRNIRKYYPELWLRMLEMDKAQKQNRGFRGYHTVADLELRFKNEDKQLGLL